MLTQSSLVFPADDQRFPTFGEKGTVALMHFPIQSWTRYHATLPGTLYWEARHSFLTALFRSQQDYLQGLETKSQPHVNQRHMKCTMCNRWSIRNQIRKKRARNKNVFVEKCKSCILQIYFLLLIGWSLKWMCNLRCFCLERERFITWHRDRISLHNWARQCRCSETSIVVRK